MSLLKNRLISFLPYRTPTDKLKQVYCDSSQKNHCQNGRLSACTRAFAGGQCLSCGCVTLLFLTAYDFSGALARLLLMSTLATATCVAATNKIQKLRECGSLALDKVYGFLRSLTLKEAGLALTVWPAYLLFTLNGNVIC